MDLAPQKLVDFSLCSTSDHNVKVCRFTTCIRDEFIHPIESLFALGTLVESIDHDISLRESVKNIAQNKHSEVVRLLNFSTTFVQIRQLFSYAAVPCVRELRNEGSDKLVVKL